MADDDPRRMLYWITDERSRWRLLGALRPADGSDDPYGTYDPQGPVAERQILFDLATMGRPGADDDDPPTWTIAETADRTSICDIVGMLCREVLRLRLELAERR